MSLKTSPDNHVKSLKKQHQGMYIQVPMYVALEWDSSMRQQLLFDSRVIAATVEGNVNRPIGQLEV